VTDDELRQLFEKQNADLRGYIDARTSDLHLHFDTVAERIEDKVALLAEGIAHVDQKLDRAAADLRRDMREGFDDTHALIRFTYSELDRRLRALE